MTCKCWNSNKNICNKDNKTCYMSQYNFQDCHKLKNEGDGMSKRKQIVFRCPKCGKDAVHDKEKSNENWAVIEPQCPDCKVGWEIVVE